MAAGGFFVCDVRGGDYSHYGCVFAGSLSAAATKNSTAMMRRPPLPWRRFGNINVMIVYILLYN
jgi:hypothetical protein